MNEELVARMTPGEQVLIAIALGVVLMVALGLVLMVASSMFGAWLGRRVRQAARDEVLRDKVQKSMKKTYAEGLREEEERQAAPRTWSCTSYGGTSCTDKEDV